MIPHLSERALILAPRGRDADIAASMLVEAGLKSQICDGLTALVRELEHGAGFALLAEEGLRTADLNPLAQWLQGQPEWSDFPFVLLTQRGGGLERNPSAQRFLGTLGNVTFLERPFHPTTLISLAQSALRGRRRQYEARARLEELHVGAEKYRSLFESIDAGFCIIEIVFDEAGKPVDYIFREANPAFERQTGLKNAVGMAIRSMVPGHEQHWFDIYGKVALTGESIRFEHEADALGGYWYDVYALRVGDPAARQVAVLFNDITQRRRIEAALRESEERLRGLNETLEERVAQRSRELELAQEALRQSQKLEAMGQLTGGVAHDFNNLLTPIVGSLDLLQRRGLGTERERRLIDGAVQSADRAKTLVQRLLAFARRQPLQVKAIDISALIRDMADLIASTSGPRVKVELAVADDLPPARADANQIEMALLNLAVNARDAMPEGGTLTIGATVQKLVPRNAVRLPSGEFIRLYVEDTGIGMDEKTIAKAIEPFFTTKGVGQGTGLGLSMVHGLAAQLGGGLTIDSKLGEGTTINLWLPVSQKPLEETASVTEVAMPQTDRGTVLVVDDEDLVRASTAHMLSELGYSVLEAVSAEDALKVLDTPSNIDLLVTDHLMPGITGTDLAGRARKMRPDLRILVISGYAETKGISPDLPRLTKPFKQTDLAASLAHL
ncbi:hybrid sensor histidine kinase/response regulator [Sphingobium sp. SCG-1]|uniref:hybrid sensor histidine kinase/response regulator n=1 Tax=Sphingobium sp. SCG-1 TaxID=2072936 RepID=UPI000CD69C54|nr:ATP-binding protein [Sphingobium sp. SCG-1]AUW56784.1 hybrid sensor histidine kinase/response regulator [Sphingobium sp. SCG-1]